MALLDDLTPGVSVKGLLPGGSVSIVGVKRHGSTSIELVYQDADGQLGSELLYSDDIGHLEIVPAGLPWRFDADGALFRLASEAYRIRLAYLFDPLIAVHTSRIEPLPHQITAVYETMLAKQPLRYLLADLSWQQDTFAYAESWDETRQRYLGLKAGEHVQVALNASSVLVKPEVAAAQFAADAAVQAAVRATPAATYVDAAANGVAVGERGGAAILEPAGSVQTPTMPPPAVGGVPGQSPRVAASETQYRRFYGSVKINPRLMAGEAGKIMEEVVKHLTTLYGAEVQVTLEIQATMPNGAPEGTRRTVEENCRTLRFEVFGFEVE